ncbi:MAG: hypothetical protein HY817_01480 [Candidatus Abawacabacteria bacterium]|nr:hypothetical protein [Candidatus Abawacabacteria bacterium]
MNYKSHFKKRIKQRYGFKINRKDYYNIISLIKKGRAIFVEPSYGDRTIHIVLFKGKSIKVVYDAVKELLITALNIQKSDIKLIQEVL